jgi:hypothetical protein
MFPRRTIGINGSAGAGDPTKNVLDLVNAAIARVDDLRESETRHQTEVARLLVDRVEAMMAAESNRIDAIRAVDVDAVRKDSMASAVQAQTLAAQVSQTAEAMRTQVAATASAAASALTQATEAMRTQITAVTAAAAASLEPIIKDVAELRRAQYEAQGQKTQIVETQAKGGSASNWLGLVVAANVGIFSLIVGAAAIIISIMAHKP